jgi:glycosyltransferase involved in cell wall biosynthesis
MAPGDCHWFKKRFDNQDNIFALFQRADFYILMHRISVFDLAILQAMAYGCIPVLSDVEGNREFCGFDNGILIDADNIDERALRDQFGRFREDGGRFMRTQSERNKRVVREVFNNRNFLAGYRDALAKL